MRASATLPVLRRSHRAGRGSALARSSPQARSAAGPSLRRRLLLPALLPVLLPVLLVGCSPLRLEPAPPGEQLREAQRSVLTSGRLSGLTVNILEWEGLPPVASEDAAMLLRQRMAVEPDAVRLVALAEISYALGMAQGGGLGRGWDHLTVAMLASWTALFHPELNLSPHSAQWEIARTLHNASLGQVVIGLAELPGERRSERGRQLFADRAGDGTPGDGPLDIEVDYRWRADAWTAEVFERFLLADDFRVRGMRNRNRQSGLGAALLGERVAKPDCQMPPAERSLPPFYQTVALSAVVTDVAYRGEQAWPPVAFDLQVHDPNRTTRVAVADVEVPLESDFTAALTHTIARGHLLRGAGFGGLRDVGSWSEHAGLYMLEPFDPNRIPVVFSHGLVSSPAVWREMINDLWSDPIIRARYQFWFFLYPTGNPFVYSALALRTELEKVWALQDPDRTSPARECMVLVGHSMGGLVSRMLVTEPGEALWESVSNVPFDEAQLTDDDRELLRRALRSDPVPEVSRVVFIATPHRGSVIADLSIGRIGSRLIRLPPSLLETAGRIFAANPDQVQLSRGGAGSLSTGIDTLSPNSPSLMALAELPIAPGVTAHSIIGRRSGGDGPGGSDGVVRFESAHLPCAASELIIAGADHSVPNHPAATREVRRILLLHLKECDGARPRTSESSAASAPN